MLLGSMSSSKSDINFKEHFPQEGNSNVERHVVQIACEGHAYYKITMNK